MAKHALTVVTALTAVLMLTSCSETPKETETKKADAAPAAPPEPIAGQSAFYQMYKPAREWAKDIMPLTLAGSELESIKSEGGKFPMWTAVFVSPSLRQARTFFYAVAAQGSTVHKGVSIGGAQLWSGATPKSKPFSNAEFNVNSDTAYNTAAAKAADWLKKNPDKKCTSMLLASASRFPSPVWYILWGNNKSGYDLFINATTGQPVAVGKGK